MSNTRIEREIIKRIAENFLANGDLSEDDLKNRESLFPKLIELARRFDDYLLVVDHTDSLLDQADKFSVAGELDLSIMLYATYFEHGMNHIINYDLNEKSISPKSKNELIRAVNISGKCGWVLELLGLPKFNKNHVKVITDLSAERNAFVHYKWNPEQDQSKVTQDKKVKLIEKARKTSTYMKQYTSRVKYKGQKGNLKKTLTK